MSKLHLTLTVSLLLCSSPLFWACGSPDSAAGSQGVGDASDAATPDSSGGATDAGSDTISDSAMSDGDTSDASLDGQTGDSSADAGTSATCSAYAVQVSPPPYDPKDPKQFLIETKEDWEHIDDPDKTIFYVEPGIDYGPVKVTSSGTASAPRYLVLHEGSDAHPAKLPVSKQASVRLRFEGASHWVVHRLSALDYTESAALSIRPVSHDIVIDQMNFSNFGTAIEVVGRASQPTTRNITIQRCRMDSMSSHGIDGDRVAVILSGSPWKDDYSVEDVHIVDNEIRNSNDGVMLLRHPELPGGQHVNYPGTVVDCNQIYVDSDVYTDGTGKHDPQGLWALTENAVDLKGGSDDPSRPVVVSNNYMWGYRHTDTNGGGSGSWGTAFGGHYDVKNLKVFGNVIFDSNRGLDFADPHGLPYSVENLDVRDNIFYNIGFSTSGDTEYCHYFYYSKNVTYEHNTVVGVDKHSTWFSHDGSEQGMVVRCNAIVGSATERGRRASGTVVSDNFFYGTDKKTDDEGIAFGQASDANLSELTFTADRFTNHPRQITLPGVVTTSSSPHAGWCHD